MISKYWNRFDLKNRAMIVMGLFIFVVVTIFLVIFSRTYNTYEENLVGQESLNTLHTLDNSIQSFIQTADNYSKMLVADNTVQEEMAKSDLIRNFSGQQKISQKVYSIKQFSDIDEIWFIDLDGNTLKVGEYSSSADDKKLEDYEELRTPYGRAKVLIEAGKEDGSISIVRSYNSTTDFTSIGIIGVVISKKTLYNQIRETVDITREKLLIIDGDDNIVFWSDDREEPDDYIALAAGGEFEKGQLLADVKLHRNKMLMSGIVCENPDWKILRFTMLPIATNQNGLFRLNMAIVILIGVIMIAGSSVMAVILSTPSQVMLDAMSTAQNGVPKKIREKSSLKEFELLYDGYNSMVDRISQLIDETIERQKRIRQVELNEIQEQMKPHFLYNTLESVEALAMMGDIDRVCQLIEALGDFYRKSVSGGKEFLTIEEEIRIARDYIQIMEIRFGNTFNTEINCDHECMGYLIPKLTIQPLLENAFQYGVRAKNNHGDVIINVLFEGGNIHISVEDSGDGVPDDVVNEISGKIGSEKGRSLGLRGTIERLRLMYGDSFRYDIKRNPSKIDLYIYCGSLKGKD